MKHYTQSILIAAAPAAVYDALTTAQGLRGWWSKDCDVDNRVGGELRFRFGPHYKHMRIEKLEPDSEVRWRCTVAHIDVDRFTRKDEWVGTELVFHLSSAAQGQTRLDFEHVGLMPQLECYDLCKEGWQYFMLSLQQFVATGRGTPFAGEPTCAASAA